MHKTIWGSAILILVSSIAASACKSSPEPTQAPSLEDAHALYDNLPQILSPLPLADIPEGLASLSAAGCGGCHTEIYAEWKASTHSQAWLGDPQFQAELHKGDPTQSDTRWICVNCHTPLENQLPQLVAGLKDNQLNQPIYIDNPNYDKDLQLEAITCATCHVKDGKIIGTIGSDVALHGVTQDPSLKAVETCTQCHQAYAQYDEINLGCFFNTGQEFQASSHAQSGKTCQSCHMPEVERPITILGTPVRKSHRHFFGGSLIPKTPEAAAGVEKYKAYYDHGLSAQWIDPPAEIQAQEGVLTVEIANANAGHYLPTGDPERFILIDIEIRDEGDRLLGKSHLELGSKYQWWPEIKKRSDNRLAPDEKRQIETTFEAPAGKFITATLTASKWRINEENLNYHDLDGRYIPGMTFIEKSLQIGVSH